MGKSMNGPDTTDVAMLMSAIGALHTCRVVLCVTADIQGHNGTLDILAEARFDLLPDSSLPRVITVVEKYPSNKAATLTGILYNAIWQLDYRISQVYEQMTLLP